MFTPEEIQNKQFKTGLGYDKKDVELFLHDLSSDFSSSMNENEELRKKLKDMNESLSYYKSIEKTLQKALILAEKTAQDTRAAAMREADVIEAEAKTKASHVLEDARRQIEYLEHKTLNLMQQYDMFKIQFENLLHAQLDLLNSKSFSINTDDFTYRASSGDKTVDTDTNNSGELLKSCTATAKESDTVISDQEDIDQMKFDFLEDTSTEKSYETEDGFEFINIRP